MGRPISANDLRWEWPQLRLPIYFIVDDPAPCINLAYYEQYFESHVRDVPNSFTSAWADLIEEFGVRGKFSVLPIPAAIGRIDRPLPDVKPADQAEFLKIIRERVLPQMDICIEFLTHFLAWDIRRDRPVDYTEKTMSPHIGSTDYLTEYFAYGLRILQDVGLQPTGATSPGFALIEREYDYQKALRNALRDVTGLPIAWYFLHMDDRSPVILPRIMSINGEKGEACVTVLSMTGDPSWQTQFEKPSDLDILLTADGQAGRLAELYRNRSPLGFHTHWQSLFSEGRATGLHDLRITLSRIQEHFGDGVKWTKCSELAQTVSAQAATQATVSEQGEGVAIQLSSTIPCPDFTVRLVGDFVIRSIHAGDKELRALPDGSGPLEPGTWRRDGDSIVWCADLNAGETMIFLK